MFENRHNLLTGDGWKILQKLVERNTRLQILKKSRHRHPRPFEDARDDAKVSS